MNKRLELIVAAMLHDIGKLMQRADIPLSTQAENTEQMLCPTSEHGHASHRHVLWTSDFIEQHTGWLDPGLDKARIARLAAQHHRPSTPEEWMITEADRMASGHDRRTADEDAKRVNFREVPFSSVFSQLRLHKKNEHPLYYLSPGTMSADEKDVWPLPQQPAAMRDDYHWLAGQVTDTVQKWPQLSATAIPGALLGLSQIFLSRITSTAYYKDKADISLHDHSCLVAAIVSAMCNYHWHTGSIDNESAIKDRKATKYRFIVGDLSGIQQYIFEAEDHKGAARSYRAKSFYLQVLTHIASQRLLEAAQVSCLNRVMDAGGRFQLLVDSSDETYQKITTTAADMEGQLVKEHAGLLSLNLDMELTCSGEDFMGDKCRTLFDKIQQHAGNARTRRLSRYLQHNGTWSSDGVILPYENTREWMEKQHEQAKKLGRELPRASYLAILDDDADCAGLLSSPMPCLGRKFQLLKDITQSAGSTGVHELISLAQTQQVAEHALGCHAVARYLPRLTQSDINIIEHSKPSLESAEDDDEVLRVGNLATFEHLAWLSRAADTSDGNIQQHRGQAMIACLKADVDRLGLLFSAGLGDNISFGRVASLSRQMDWFFKALLPEKLSDENGPYRLVYTVFAGGDDLFLVGPWTVILDLAAHLHQWFSAYTSNNPDVTISAGVVFGHPRAPLAELAHQAEERLEEAKNGGRNRIALLGRVMTWDDYANALQEGKKLDDRLQLSKPHVPKDETKLSINSGFVYRLLQYELSAQKVDQNKKDGVSVHDLGNEITWRSHLSYDMYRNLAREKHLTPGQQEDLDWLGEITGLNRNGQLPALLRLAATYALYRNRGGAR